ncbi:hypothetical protein KY334_06575 [Candidatus Woesearchaeota archaeon]|nr:hypothetical protein [Candidatus Woesearchaeota archaeon]
MIINARICDYNKDTKTFFIKGGDVQFGTAHEIKNYKTGNSMFFNLDHSTGSEWDPTTKWIYKSKEGYFLEVGNEEVTPQHANNYLEHKLRNM